MRIKLLYHGPLWHGSTSLQRVQAFSTLPNIEVISADNGLRVDVKHSLLFRVLWKLRWPMDIMHENETLLRRVSEHRPDIVIIDNSKVIKRSTLQSIRKIHKCKLVYYTPDDIMNKQNLSYPLQFSFPDWDVFFTTKTFNIEELKQAGVRKPLLIGKSYDPNLHFPMTCVEIGSEYETFDLVFIGSYEAERCNSINCLAEAGYRIVVYGGSVGGWNTFQLHKSVTLRQAEFADNYRRCWHHGKLALVFLKKINRDQITQRTMEVAAMGRPMLAEKTVEHDQHFLNGKEYIGFSNDQELVSLSDWLLNNENKRKQLGLAVRKRCEISGYSTIDRAKSIIDKILDQ